LFSVPPVLRLNEGRPLDWRIRRRMEESFGANLGAVRVHRSRRAVKRLGAKAFAFGPNIILGSHSQGDDLGLMAHEVAHTIQQGNAPVPQFFSRDSDDPYEREAREASAAVLSGQSFRVTGRTAAPRVQRLGVRDALDYFANAADNIPGFPMLTYVIRFNPIRLQEVPRNATNLFRAIIGFLPGGNLIFEALQRHGILDRVGAWLEEQFRNLGMGARSFREALDQFLGSLGWRDIFNLGGLWQRAQRIFTGPIDRLIGFVRSLAGGILGFIRTAILRPVARLAQGTRGYDLLRLVLAQDPITGDPYPRTAENMIGGFMCLIGEEEKWRHLRESRALPRAWAWFQEQIGTLMGFVREIPQLFSRLWQSLQISDLLDIGGAFNRARGIFGGFVERFVSWAGNAALQIMIFIFEALAPRAMPVLRRAASVLGTIVRQPVRFVGNLVRAGLRGFEQFRTNIRQHLLNGLVGWLTGALTNAGLQLPTRWDARGILSLALQILGLTWQNIRVKLVRVMGETAVRALETTFELLVTLVREGPAAAWQRILEHLGNLRDMVFERIRAWVTNTIVGQAVVRILSMLNPAGAVIQAIIAIYDTIIFFRDRLQQISQVAESFFNSIAEIAAGNIGAAANRVEQTMGRLVPVVIGFLASFMHLGGISGTIRDIIARLRAPIDRALDRVVDWIAAQARMLASRAAGAVVGWWREQRAVRIGRVAAMLSFRGENRDAQLMIAASPPAPLLTFLSNDPTIRSLSPSHPVLLQIRTRIGRIDTIKNRPSGGATATEGSEIQGLFREIADRLGQLGVGRPPRSRVAWAGMRTVGGFPTPTQMDASVLSIDSGGLVGSRPTQAPPLWTAVNVRSGVYIRGHLLNHHLFGPGTNENLVPITRETNAQMSSQVEEPLKAAVLQQNKVIAYRVTVVYGTRSPRLHVPAETYLPTQIGLGAWELTPGPGTGEAAWNAPVRRPLLARVLSHALPADTAAGLTRPRVDLSRDGALAIIRSLRMNPLYNPHQSIMLGYCMRIERMRRPTPFHLYEDLTDLGIPSAFVALLRADEFVTLR
jgi:uncharacterized protein DUF4157/DNA/RNA non-specific endonuclease